MFSHNSPISQKLEFHSILVLVNFRLKNISDTKLHRIRPDGYLDLDPDPHPPTFSQLSNLCS